MIDETAKVRNATLYLTNTATLWWIRRFANMEKDICTIEMWEDFKREIKRQFYPKNVAYLVRKNMRHLKHTNSIRDYVNEFSSLMLEIPNMTEEELLFNFIDNLQGWVEQELRHRGVQDLATTTIVVESLTDYKRGDSSKVESLKDSHAMLLEWDQTRCLTYRKQGVRRKGKSLYLKSNASCVTVHIGNAIVQRGRRSMP